MVTEADMERERQEARLRFRRDITSALAAAIEDGFREGYEPGWEKCYERMPQAHRKAVSLPRCLHRTRYAS